MFVIGIIFAIITLGSLIVTAASKKGKRGAPGAVTGIAALVAVGAIGGSMYFANGVGEAQVQINRFTKDVVKTVTATGAGFRSPWTDTVPFDLFSQELSYAGNGKDAPSYTGGSVSGAEVTVSVGGVNGGSTQGNMDISATYSIDADEVEAIYRKYRSQERFTQQVIEKTFLSTIRTIPSDYTATEFRGVKRTEAADKMAKAMNDELNKYGVTIDFVNIQDIRYPEEVESALKQVEVANQQQQKAEADLRAAETAAKQKVVEAQAEADANRELAKSLSPEILEQRRIDALREAAKNGNLIIDGGDGGVLVQH